jgi:hypothetical protein
MGALLSIPLVIPSITGIGGWVLSCCGAAAVNSYIFLADDSALLSVDLVGHVPPASPLELLMLFSSSSTPLYTTLDICINS